MEPVKPYEITDPNDHRVDDPKEILVLTEAEMRLRRKRLDAFLNAPDTGDGSGDEQAPPADAGK
jgi:hypothetical protein